MPFNVASIKEKASQAKNTTVNKFQDTRDKYSSAPMAKTKFAEAGYVPDARKQPPPPPPVRPGSSTRTSAVNEPPIVPPPIARNTKPSTSMSSIATTPSPLPAYPRLSPLPRKSTPSVADFDRIDWVNLSSDDKQEFFSWLDEFFARYLNGRKPTSAAARSVTIEEPPIVPPAAATAFSSTTPSLGHPPVVKSWSKPKLGPTIQPGFVDFEMSYPPSTTHGCQALDLAYYIHPSTEWDTHWYIEDNAVPPPLKESMQRTWRGFYTVRGDQKLITFGVLFSDLSICWLRVGYNTTLVSEVTERHAEYIAPPLPLPREALVEASEMYGDTIAGYAESFLESGQFCARGECWDLANEGIKCLDQYDYVPKPVQSMNRTHGHLIFEGKAFGKNQQVGRWRGGDDRVRRGDIVEWKSVKINRVNAPPGSWSTLGDPDHTAVITKDSVPTRVPHDGESLLPSELVELEVVEQSRNYVPTEPQRHTYDMGAFEQGEVWIYRPVSIQTYMGIAELTPTPPEDMRTLKI